jgi:hypothetical protein
MDYIRNLDGVKCLVIIFRVILLWNSEALVETTGAPEKRAISPDKTGLLGLAVRCELPRKPALTLAMLEKFHLAQALLGLGFGLVRSAEILLAVLRQDLVSAFQFANHGIFLPYSHSHAIRREIHRGANVEPG